MRTCKKCNLEKDETEFHLRKNQKAYQHYCKTCYISLGKDSYKRCKKYLEDIKKESGCIYCGNHDIEVLDFHHRNKDEKKCNVTKLTTIKNASIEAAKCDIVCVNCHRKLERNIKLTKISDMLVKLSVLVKYER